MIEIEELCAKIVLFPTTSPIDPPVMQYALPSDWCELGKDKEEQ